MKVEGTPITPVNRVEQTKQVGLTDSHYISQEDGVAVSAKAELYKSLQTKLKDVPTVREEKVQELTQAINSGKFKVDAKKIAAKLLRMTKD